MNKKIILLVLMLCMLHSKVVAREAAFVTQMARNIPSANVFASKLREVRKSLGLIQVEMAARLNITHIRYILLETGRTLPGKVEEHQALVDVLKVSATELEEMLQIAKSERKAQTFLTLLQANDVSVDKLEHYVATGKSYGSLIRAALLREEITLEELIQHSVGLGYMVVLSPSYREDLEAISHALHIDYDLLREAAMIDHILRSYMIAVRSQGELPLPVPLLRVLDQGLELDRQRVEEIVQEGEASFPSVLYLAMQAQGYSIKKLNQKLSLPHNRVSSWLSYLLFPETREITALVKLLHPNADKEKQQQLIATWQHLVHKSRTNNLLNYELRRLNLTWEDVAAYDVATISIISNALKHEGIGVSKFEQQHNLRETTLFYHLRGTRQPNLDNLPIIHRELLSDYDFDQLHKLAQIERFAWFYQGRVKEYGEFLPEGEQRHALENVWRIRAKAIDEYLTTKKKT